MIGNIRISDLSCILFVTLLLLAFVVLRLRRKTPANSSLSIHNWRERFSFLYFARLTGFFVLAIILIGGSLLIYMDYKQVSIEIAATPSQVDIPSDLPFSVTSVAIKSESDIQLAGWYSPPKNGAVIILLHGYGGNRLHTVAHAMMLQQAGYGVLMYDQRASGESGGVRRSYGWEDAPDVGAVIAHLRSRPELASAKLGIAGCSMGGQIALQGAARYAEIGAVWADGPAVIRFMDNPAPKGWANAIAYLSNWIIDPLLAVRLGIPAPPAMIDRIGAIAPRPIYLVGGGLPKPYLGSEEPRVQRYAQFAGDNAQVWIIPEATHCDGPQQRPDEYAERLVDFFDQALLR